MIRAILVGLVIALSGLFSIPPSLASDYRYELRPGDEVRITVYKEPEMSGTFRVSATGSISIPGIGELKTMGMTAEELRVAAISALSARHYTNPDVAMEIVKYGPVFIMGDVRNPGRQEYIPGLTVTQLVAIAGGYPLLASVSDGSALSRDADRQRQDLASAQHNYAVQTVKRARLIAERDGEKELPALSELENLVGKERLEQIKSAERHLMRTRAEEEAQRMQLRVSQQKEVEKSKVALEEQLIATRRLRDIVDVDLKNIKELKERGLTASTRVLDLERMSSDTDMRLNNTIALIAQSNQTRINIELEIKRSSEERRITLAEQLIEVETELATLRRRITDATEFLNNHGYALPSPSGPQAEIVRSFTLVREASPEQVAVNGNDPVLPGDVLIVTRETMTQPAGLGAAPLNTQDPRTRVGSLPPSQD
ncbi:polysaccharide biosynthesis/export family protein [Microvirga guangxiensis]|nr:polysaccharide biosynthesis/export family protein [Microvirga guangxiensis]